MSTPEITSHRWRPRPLELAAIVVSGLVLVLGVGGYLVGYFVAGDKLPKNAVVAGVAVGGLSPAEAEQKLTRQLGRRAAQPVLVNVNGTPTTIDPVRAGLGLDAAASVAQAGGGRSFDPRHIWRVLTGGSATDAVITAEPAKLDATVAALAVGSIGRPRTRAWPTARPRSCGPRRPTGSNWTRPRPRHGYGSAT